MATDNNFVRILIPTVSKCRCCTESETESLHHLLLDSRLANYVWNKLCPLFNIRADRQNIQHFMNIWIQGAELNSQYSFTRVVTCLTACWVIWNHQNEILHNEKNLNPPGVVARIWKKVRDINSNHFPKLVDSRDEQRRLEAAGFTVKTPIRKNGVWLNWIKPVVGIKLN